MEKDNKDNIKKMLDGITNKANMDEETLNFISGTANLAAMCKAVYTEMLNQGFSIEQAYDFMKEYIIRLITKK